MHVQILGKLEGFEIDHINGDKLDNRRCNLRYATHTQNQQNTTGKGGSSKYKGVSWDTTKNKWISQIISNGERIRLGQFDREDDAAKSYNEAARLIFKEFAWLNIIDV